MVTNQKKIIVPSSEEFITFSLISLTFFLFLFEYILNFFPSFSAKYLIIFYIISMPLMANLLFSLFLDKGPERKLNLVLATKVSQAFAILSLVTIIYHGLKNITSVIYIYSSRALPTVIPISNERFIEGAIGGLLFLMIAILICFISKRQNWSHFFISRVLRYGVYVIGCVLVLTLFDPHIVDIMRGGPTSGGYAPYTGPAASVLLGGIPLIDVFSQYGLGYLLFSLAWLIVPPSLLTAGILVCLFNLFFYLSLLAIIVKITHNKLLSFIIGVGLILFINSFFAYDIDTTPSVLAFRFFPPLLLVFALCRLPPNKLFQWDTLGALFLTSLWSIETMIGGFIIYSTYLILVGIRQRKPIAGYLYEISSLIILTGLPHIILTLSYLVIFNQWPRYDIYLDMIGAYAGGTMQWHMQLDPFFKPPFLFAFAYGLILSYTLRDVIKTEKGTSETPKIGALAIFGVLQFMYYLGRPTIPLLSCVFFPLAALAILPVDWAVTQLSDYRKTRHYMTWPTLIIAFVLFPLMSATFMDKYPAYPTGYTLLWGCLNTNPKANPRPICSPMEAFKLIKDQIDNDSPSLYSYKETLAFIEKYQQDKKDVIIFHRYSPAILLFAQKRQRLGFSSSNNESLSPALIERDLQYCSVLQKGDIVIIRDPIPNNLEWEVLNKLKELWQLCFLESAAEEEGKVDVYYLESKKEACRLPINNDIRLMITTGAKPFMLPDGSEVANSSSQVWVKTPDQSHYATAWKDYTKEKGLTIQALVVSGQGEQKPTLTIKKGTPPFKFPDGSEIMVKENDEVWVKLPGQSDYSTPWAKYAKQQGLEITPVIVRDF